MKKTGVLEVRKKPCVCKACLAQQWDECAVGGWKTKQMQQKGTRNPNAKHLQQQLNEQNVSLEEGEYVVNAIHAKRVRRGVVEYLVEWKGYNELTWTKAGDLNCDELLEDWDIDNEVQEYLQTTDK